MGGRSWSNWVLTSLLEPLMSPLNPVKRAPKVAFQALEESTLVSKLVVYVWVPVVATVAGRDWVPPMVTLLTPLR